MAETTKSNVFKKKAEIMKELRQLPLNGYNDKFEYKYTKEIDLVEAIRPLLAKYGLAITTQVLDESSEPVQTKYGMSRRTKVKMEFKLTDSDNVDSFETCIFYGEAIDNTDKGFYKAYTNTKKYYLFTNFLVSGGDDADVESETTTKQEPQENNKKNKSNWERYGKASDTTNKKVQHADKPNDEPLKNEKPKDENKEEGERYINKEQIAKIIDLVGDKKNIALKVMNNPRFGYAKTNQIRVKDYDDIIGAIKFELKQLEQQSMRH